MSARKQKREPFGGINISAFQWEGRNELWDELMRQLEVQEEAEISAALAMNLTGEMAAHARGRAEFVREWRTHLQFLRTKAAAKTDGQDKQATK